MDFKKFCEENLLFGFTPPFPELTEAFYMDCFINHQLQELLYPKGIKKLPENSGKTLEKDFDYMLSSLIKRIPPHIIKCFLLKIQSFSTLYISVNKPQPWIF